jgi:hypothetical protein
VGEGENESKWRDFVRIRPFEGHFGLKELECDDSNTAAAVPNHRAARGTKPAHAIPPPEQGAADQNCNV